MRLAFLALALATLAACDTAEPVVPSATPSGTYAGTYDRSPARVTIAGPARLDSLDYTATGTAGPGAVALVLRDAAGRAVYTVAGGTTADADTLRATVTDLARGTYRGAVLVRIP